MDVQANSTLVWIPLLPLIGALLNGLLGKRLFRNGPMVSVVGVGTVGLAALLAWINFFQLMGHEHGLALQQVVFEWFHVGGFDIDFALWFDPLAAVMVLVVTNVGFLIHLYSVGYMDGDPGYYRYFSYLNLFLFAMLCLVLGDNLVVLFLGGEGVGLCSYLLIGFWFENMEYAKAGKKAFIANRIGDLGFLLGMFLLFAAFGTLRPAEINELMSNGLPPGLSLSLLNAAALCLFVGATGKSAQIPLYVWLPDAMAGPTPVSALIHAATMVTAGVYMIARLNGVYFHAELASQVVLYVGAATALFSATIGLVQNDIKKVLAYSTVSQLGFMFAAMGAGAYAIGIFHLMTHAFFKALLFLGSGSIILAMHHSQDMRHYGGLRKHMPVTYFTFFVATLAIAGVPFFAGFYSKDEILLYAMGADGRGGTLAWVLLTLAAFCTAFYMFRIMWMTFWGEYRGVPAELMHHHGHGDEEHHVDPATWRPTESPWTITVPLIALAVLSFLGGWLGATPVTSFGISGAMGWPTHGFLGEFLHPSMAHSEVHLSEAAHNAEVGFMLLSVMVAAAAIAVAWWFYKARPEIPARLAERWPDLHQLLMDKYRVDEAYDSLIIEPIERGSRSLLWRVVDVILIDGFVHGLAAAAKVAARVFGWFQTGDTQRYALWMVAGVLLVTGMYFVMAGGM
jgi:NADH-quinone oxidoreductase subunit L